MALIKLRFARFSLIAVLVALAGGCASGGTGDGLQTVSPRSTASGSQANSSGGLVPGTVTDDGIRIVSDLPPPPNTAGGTEVVFAPGDILEVSVFGVPDLGRTVQVDSQGRISLPLIGDILASGKSRRKLETDIAAAYGSNYLQSPQVSIFVKESLGQRVTIDGEVNKAGIFPTTNSSSLVQVIAQAGGFNQIANPKQVLVFRQIGEQRLAASYNVVDIRKGRKGDPRIFGGDVIVVPNSSFKIASQNLKEALGVARGVGGVAAMGL